MPYKPRQAKAVLANTSSSSPRHREARRYAKKALKGKAQRVDADQEDEGHVMEIFAILTVVTVALAIMGL